MFKKIIVGLCKLIAGCLLLIIIVRGIGLLIPVHRLTYQNIPDDYFATTGVQILSDEQNQYIKFLEFMSGDYQALMSGQSENLSEIYAKALSGDYTSQLEEFYISNSGRVSELSQYYSMYVIPTLSGILFTGQRGALDTSLHTIDVALINYVPVYTQRLVRELNMIAGLYCTIGEVDQCKKYQSLALLIGEKQIIANISMIGTLIGISNTKTSLKSILYFKNKGIDLGFASKQLSFIDGISYKYLLSSEYTILKNTIQCINGGSCGPEELTWITEDYPNYRMGKLIDEEQFNGYIKDIFYRSSQCTTQGCFDKLEQQRNDLSYGITFWDKMRPALGPQHMQNFITRILLIAIIPRITSYETYLFTEEIKSLKNSILSIN